RLQPHGRIDLFSQDRTGAVRSDLLDFDAALRRGDHTNTLDLAVEHEPEVELADEGLGPLDVEPVNDLALGAGLGRDQRRAEHRLGGAGDFGVCAAELDAPRLAAPA